MNFDWSEGVESGSFDWFKGYCRAFDWSKNLGKSRLILEKISHLPLNFNSRSSRKNFIFLSLYFLIKFLKMCYFPVLPEWVFSLLWTGLWCYPDAPP